MVIAYLEWWANAHHSIYVLFNLQMYKIYESQIIVDIYYLDDIRHLNL